MILESIVTTTNADGSTNVAPMGPVLKQNDFSSFVLRPFKTSMTFSNLDRTRRGVMHITDDVKLFVAGALNSPHSQPHLAKATSIEGMRLADCCRYFEFQVEDLDVSNDRTEMICHVVNEQEIRPFWGFNRAKHAILELAILATRIHILDHNEIKSQFTFLESAVIKTGGTDENEALIEIKNYFAEHGIMA